MAVQLSGGGARTPRSPPGRAGKPRHTDQPVTERGRGEFLVIRGSYGRQGLSGAAGGVSAKVLDQQAVQQRAEADLLLGRQSVEQRGLDRADGNKPVLQRPLESGQYASFRLAEHLDSARIAASIGSVGDAYDNALMESTIGLFKTEVIKPQRPWKTLSHVELATAEWVDWYNHRRLHGEIGHIPPAEAETR